MSERIGFSMLLIALLALLFGHFIPAQVTTATILGTTRDESGGLIPGVSVTVTNLGTGIERSVITDDQGRYRVPALSLGNYEVEASLTGFQTAVRSGITLTVGREAVVNLTMRVGEIIERVTVTGEAPLVQTTSASLEDLVGTQQIEDLPLNGRSYTQLALLQPGVVTVGSTNFGGVSGGGAKLSVAGTRSTTTYFYLDGTDVKGGLGHTPGSAAGQTLGVETIREFSLLANNYSAEYGGSGGVINTVTKSGTNEFHGSVFEFHRNSALDARNFFDRDPRNPGQRSDPPAFKRNQFGFTVGGPIVSDRTFFFGSFEALRDRLSNTSIINVPTAALKQGQLPSGPVEIHPVIQRYLDVMPLPNGQIFNDGSGEFSSARSQPTSEDYFMARLDHRFSDEDSIFGRYVFDDAERVQPLSYPQFLRTALTRSQYLTIEETKIISAEWLNTLQFGFTRSLGADANQVDGLDASYNLIPLPERVPPELQMPTLQNWGSAASGDRFVVLNSFQVRDKLSYTAGRHSLRTGFELYRNQYNGFTRSRIHGRARFDTLEDFLRGRILSWEFMAPGTGNMRGFRYWDFGVYLQDDIQLKPNFSLNLGLRWEFVTVPTEVAGRVSNLRDPLNDVRSTVGDPLFLLPKDNFGPRFGFAWDPFGDGKTSIRGGSGLFHSQMTHTYWRLPALQNDPFFLRVQVNNPPTFPPSVEVGDLPPLQAGPIQYDLKTPYVIQYNLTVQRELLPQTVLAVSYVGSQSRHLGRFANWNIRQFEILPDGRKFFPAGAPRFNPAFASTDTRQFDTNGHYDSLQVRLSRRFSEGLQVQSSYTYGKNIDESSNMEGLGGGGWDVDSYDPYDRSRDRGRSSFDLRHAFVFNFSYDLPGSTLTGPAGRILGGWRTNGILNLHTGQAAAVLLGFQRSRSLNITTTAPPDRPNLKPGANNSPVVGDGRDPNNYLDAGSFELQEAGTLGNLGRNTVDNPGLATFDLSFLKDVPLGETAKLQFRGELFNLFNRANFRQPNLRVFTNASGRPSGSFGRITGTTTTSRQIQFALKLLF